MELVAHELKSPLSAIESYADLMIHEAAAAGAVSRSWLDDLKRVKATAGELRKTASDLLESSLIQSGQWALERKPVALPELAAQTVSLFAPKARAAGIKLRQSWPKGLPSVQADPARLRQVLYNLISNALKFTPEGGTVEVSLRLDPASSGLACTVSDTGPGIDKAGQENLFKKLARRGHSNRESSGLGLFIAKTLVEAQGGRLWYEGTPGNGSRFHFTLPLSKTHG